jgi:tetratricopeptide (TPR) repeat protein
MSDMLAKKLHEEGVALFRQGNLEVAVQKLNDALQEANDGSRRQAEVYNDLGVAHSQLKDYAAAHQALDKAMDQFTALEDKKGQAQTLGNRAAVYEAEDLLDEAVDHYDHYKESATMLEEVGENDMAMYVWQAVSRLRMKQGQYIAAIGAYEEGVENMPKSSFKRKVIEQILKAPGKLLGNPAKSDQSGQDE